MEQSPELHAWSEKLHTASIALSKAQHDVRVDKEARKPSLWARIVDYLFQTRAEKSEENAAAELANVQAQARAFASRWIVSAAKASLANAEADYARYLAQRERVATATKRHVQVENWRGLAQDAHTLLISAADDCRSASTTDVGSK
ncbi:TPA: hypothetical protein L4R50_000345 [Pseudomonas aeruginosa]|nr:hypothetical protein [Pseudomonas aeruginosa]